MFTMNDKFIQARVSMLLARKGSPTITAAFNGQPNTEAPQLFESLRTTAEDGLASRHYRRRNLIDLWDELADRRESRTHSQTANLMDRPFAGRQGNNNLALAVSQHEEQIWRMTTHAQFADKTIVLAPLATAILSATSGHSTRQENTKTGP